MFLLWLCILQCGNCIQNILGVAEASLSFGIGCASFSFIKEDFCSPSPHPRPPVSQEGMKPDGVTMETTEPTEAIVGTEPSSTQGEAAVAEEREPAPSSNEEDRETAAAPHTAQEDNDAPAVAEAKVKPNVSLKVKPITNTTASSVAAGGAKTKASAPPNKQPGTALNRSVNGTHTSSTLTAGRLKKTTTTTAMAGVTSTLGAVPKRPTGVAASSVRAQTKVADKKPLGNARVPSAAATATNGSEAPLSNSAPKRAPVGPVNGARPRTAGEWVL